MRDIKSRTIDFAPHGIAFTRTFARSKGLKPVKHAGRHYLPEDPRLWPIVPAPDMINSAFYTGMSPEDLAELPIFKLTPFIETMRRPKGGARKEFWWKREWRKFGDLGFLPSMAVVLAPAGEHDASRAAVQHMPGYSDVRMST
ncbi:hypothetical protein [Paractinoplanes durhamensis]|uniref:Uncharacterized protein n=1 Tax=Paractinoplanes durhamensis TaxID=113563 RepID=A0ABQ3Z0W7_9ACTN|nr:hypothetical protein [Actinoplanes durhamensis]GIE03465.1 hypothetical protein Adu01nite_48150 [Actinoplanes durhamensis]